MWWENLIVAVAVFASLAWCAFRFARTLKGTGGCGCGKQTCPKKSGGVPFDAT